MGLGVFRPTPKIAIVLFPKYSHGFSIHCHDRFCHGDDDDLNHHDENVEDYNDGSKDTIWQCIKAGG